MDTSLALVILAVFAAFCISIYRKKQQDAYLQKKEQIVHAIKNQVAQIVEQDSDEERKQKILEKIKKIGIYQCDEQNLHLR
jgi:F0F1-type ATP synthase membrane subunit a